MNPTALFPLMLFGVERSYRRPDTHTGWMTLAAGIALSFYAGFPETTYLELLVVAAWAAFRIIQCRRDRWPRLAGRLVLAGGTGLLLALPLALPFAEYEQIAYIGAHAHGIGYAHLSSIALPMLGIPYLYGPLGGFAFSRAAPVGTFYGTVGGYVTVSIVVMAIAGLLAASRMTGLRVFLGIVAAVTLLWSFGVEPFAKLTTILPHMNQVSVEKYVEPDWELALILLACLGLEAVSRDGRRKRVALLAGIGTVAALIGVMLASQPGADMSKLLNDSAAQPYVIAALAWTAATVAALGAASFVRRGSIASIAVGVVLVVDAVVMAGLPQFSAVRSGTVDSAPVAFLRQHLGLDRFYSINVFHSDYGAYFQTASIDTTDLPIASMWVDEIAKLAPNVYPPRFDGRVANASGPGALAMFLQRLPDYEAIGVKYLLLPDFGGHHLYLPTMQRAGLRPVFDDGLVSIYSVAHPGPYWSTRGAPCTVTAGGFDDAIVSCTGPATLVRDGLDMPGWAASVNGSATPVGQYDGLLTSIKLPAGRSVVAFSYAPPRTDLALAGFAAGLMLMILIPGAARVRRRRKGRAVTTVAVAEGDQEAAGR